MEIGGCDTVVDTKEPIALTKRIMEFVGWKKSVMEFVGDEDPYDFFWYKRQEDKDLWDTEGLIEAGENTMIYFLIREDHLTFVTNKELTDKIKDFLRTQNETLRFEQD